MNCTAADVFDFVAPNFGDGGICPNTPEAREQLLTELNNALKILMKRLDAEGTLFTWIVPVYGGIFALPQDCLEVRQAILNGQALIQRDQWYLGKLGMNNCDADRACDGAQLIDHGDGFALPYQWPDIHFDCRLGLMAESDADAGKTVQVRLRDRYGETKEEFIQLLPNQQTAVSDSAVTDVYFTKKPVTEGNVQRFVYYPQTQQRVSIDSLAPGLENVSYRKKQLPRSYYCGSGVLKIRGKRRFQKLLKETDPLPICDEAALAFAFRALAAQRRGEIDAYNTNLTFAINELTREMQNAQSAAAVSQMTFRSGWGRQVGVKCWR